MANERIGHLFHQTQRYAFSILCNIKIGELTMTQPSSSPEKNEIQKADHKVTLVVEHYMETDKEHSLVELTQLLEPKQTKLVLERVNN
jgi:hypothetical protein